MLFNEIFGKKNTHREREKKILLLTVRIVDTKAHMLCSIIYQYKAVKKCVCICVWEREKKIEQIQQPFFVGCHWLPHPHLYLLQATRQHSIVQDWNVIFVWWQINYEHYFSLFLTRSHHLFVEYANQKHANVIWYFPKHVLYFSPFLRIPEQDREMGNRAGILYSILSALLLTIITCEWYKRYVDDDIYL